MAEIETLRRLLDEANVQTNVLAELCQCSSASIKNYSSGRVLPNGQRLLAIKEGLQKYKKMIDEIIGE